ncbi:MAG: prepilin-type N-terminal cleavage/methylation domain-containing protein [Candidatus Pacebacteria bacterium]|nr:prepilin-type N-terminal cleavage/methylation domain-containing protein [Candidatus Paceibacterota bacterium]
MNTNRGISLIELLIGASILTIVMVALVVVFQSFLVNSFTSVEKVQGALLAEEGIEAVKSIRDNDWGNLSDGTHYLTFSSDWSFTETPETIGIFSRTVLIEGAYRDVADDLASSGTSDPDTKKITVTVNWSAGTETIETYITNIHE